ncbi:nonribosomal peptide synthetase gliP [Aspergillus clavatus NRRL 1]|uniref:NRPS-like enzyme, putative n=1 Tax=Aspergillus clavatus (strain ATCC 1007 / CBS 513.65 / DSM 816 / NCTC 3887 / NRRL 1 / QM 1276 / 107) TaxID=344612 RepID=A1CGF5_ASPCL|nr:NRPS-like enzyme, putative [Aspergillus clavatus NRRL 1]EAW11035.1 NRPS-like enzyme, putative [Aspergillus clavatus NRRL 1]
MIWQNLLQELCAVLQVNPGALNLDASFVQNGGHSLSAVDWVARLKKQGIFLSVGQVLSCSNLNELFNGLLLPSKSESDGQLPPEFSDNGAISSSTSSPCLSTPPSSDVSTTDEDSSMTSQFLLSDALIDMGRTDPLSEMQASLLHGSLKNPGTNIIHHYETYPTKIIPRFKEAWKAVLEAEPIFQSSTLLMPGQAQEIFMWTELTVDTAAEYQRQMQAVAVQSSISSFTVIHQCYEGTSDGRSTIIWTVHHAMVDGYSAMLLFHKVRRLVAGLSIAPGPSFSQIEKQINMWRRTHKAEGDEYWSKQASLLQQAQGDPLLPEPQQDPVSTTPTESEEVIIASNISQTRLQTASQELGVTPAIFYYAAWAFVLSLYTDSDSVVFGAVMAGRNLPLHGIDEVVGPLINTLPLCIKLDEKQSVRDCLWSLFGQVVELAEYQWTTLDNGYSRTFASAMALQVPEPDFPEGPLPLEPPYTRQTMDVPLSINIMTNGAARFVYHTARYSAGDMARISNYFHRALQLLLRPHQIVKECLQGMLGCGDLETLMAFGNCHSGLTTAVVVQDDLVTLFESAASRHPAAIALRKGSHELEYQELDASASRVAASLRNHISDGDVVCLHADRSIHWIVGVMGILKAGGILCAVDAALPPEAQADEHLQPSACEHVLVIAEILESDQTPLAPRRLPRPADNAYLCFTSGSTGKPKGVMCRHEGLVAFQRDLEVRIFAQPGQYIAQIMSVAFDGSIHEIFSALSYGASLVLQSGGDPFAHLHDVDAAILTPSMARVLDPADFHRLATVYLVGEPVPTEVVDKWAQHKTLYNMYGPTEGTCGATIKRLLRQQRVTIGPPNPSTRLYIMNRQQELLPPGVIGEIYIAGVQVAREYIGMPQQTAERFLPDPIRRIGERMYRTGDRGYWTSNGEAVCLGRSDRQIKLRGFRLDLDDLEARMIRAVPAVTAVAVTRQGDNLIAAVLPASVDVYAFAARVTQILPPYATPRKIVALDDFPTTKAGKRDYQALAKMSIRASAAMGRPLHTPLERTVGNAFREVLRLAPDTRLNTYSSFRELGGHSLLQLLLVTRLSQAVGRQVPLRLVVQHDRIEQLASAIEKGPSLPQLLALDANTLGYQNKLEHKAFLFSSQSRLTETNWIQSLRLFEEAVAFAEISKRARGPASAAAFRHCLNLLAQGLNILWMYQEIVEEMDELYMFSTTNTNSAKEDRLIYLERKVIRSRLYSL